MKLSLSSLSFLLIPVYILSCSSASGNTSDQNLANQNMVLSNMQDTISADKYEQASRLLSWKLNDRVYRNTVRANWIHEQALWYHVNTEQGREYVLANVSTGNKEPLFDQQRMADLISQISEGETGSSDSTNNDPDIDPYSLPISDITISDDFGSVKFTYKNTRYTYNRGSHELIEGDPLPDLRNRQNYVMSPSGRYAAFIRDLNLWVKDMESGEDIQLTTTGSEQYGFATDSQGWSRSNRPILAWSADETRISTYRLDERDVEKMHLLRTAEPRPELVSWPYALPGDEYVPMHERYIIDIPGRKKVKLDTEAYHQRTSNCCGLTRGTVWADNEFSSDGSLLAYVATSRDYSEVTLKIADVQTGEVREIFSERDKLFIETNLTSRGVPNWRVLHESGEFIWYSRSSNYGHLYLHDLDTGSLKNAITSGDWNVIDIVRVDENSRRIWFTASGMQSENDPYEDYLYSVGFDGSALQEHTPDKGNHEIVLSPEAGYFVDTWSDVQNPHRTVVRDRTGSIVMDLENADISELLDTGWKAPEPFIVKARDGETDIYGLMIRPSDFDSSKTYPIINAIYPGPQTGSVGTRSFSVTRRGQAHALAELGFVVVMVDALGSPKRSRDFHTAYFGDMADNGLPDQIAAMEQLAERHSWIDIDRAGIYGHSGGGFATAAALFNYPGFFKVGVAGAGNMDNRGYTFYWGEKFQGLLVLSENDPDSLSDSYTNQALQLRAGDLEGKLLISYGTMDSNVHPNMTLLVINELIRENKDFDLLVMPNRGHGYGNESYSIRRTWDYFVMHLLGKEPPREFLIER